MKEARVLLGVVAAPHGVRGLVRIRSFTEDPMAIASYGELSDEAGKTRYRVEALSTVKGAVLARIEGVADRDGGRGDTRIAALCGARAIAGDGRAGVVRGGPDRSAGRRTDGRDWGKVMAFHDFGAGRTMEVSGGTASRHSVMLPFTDEAVPEVDIEGGKVVVDPPAGLLAGGKEKEA